MRRITKQDPFKSFADYVKRNSPKQWEQLPNDIRKEARAWILTSEQNGISGYTERLLDIEDEITHIDHYRKRSLFPALTFDWDNLIVAEHSNAYGADVKDNDAKRKVKEKNDYQYLVDPVHEDPQRYFIYLANGEMIPKDGLSEQDRKKAEYTIECFCLNHCALVNERLLIVGSIINLKKYGYSEDEVHDTLSSFSYPSVVDYFCRSEIFECL